MNLNDIKNVSDLIKANNSEVAKEDLVTELTAPIYQQDPAVGHLCAIDILENLLGFHHEIMTQMVEDGNAQLATQWAADVARIDDIITNLKQVQL